MKRFIVAALVVASSPAFAQSADEKAALAVIQRMFEGMRTADTAMVRSAFADGARFAVVGTRVEPGKIAFEAIDGWIGGIGRSNKRWEERVYDVQVRIDGNIAQIWAPYTFYLDGAVRHCGVDSIELLRNAAGEWKVTQLSDTQRREGCKDVPRP